jgi:hypothetical protein
VTYTETLQIIVSKPDEADHALSPAAMGAYMDKPEEDTQAGWSEAT